MTEKLFTGTLNKNQKIKKNKKKIHQWGLSTGNVFVFVNGISMEISLMNIKCRLNEIVYKSQPIIM